jgi:hypothetical protein
VTSEDIAFVFMALPPISMSVRPLVQVPVLEMKSAPVRLSAHALNAPVGCVIAAVAIDPAVTAPTTKAATILPESEIRIFMSQIMPNFLEFCLWNA